MNAQNNNNFVENSVLNSDMEFILEHAIMAPSRYNSQPWKFIVSDNQISVFPDFKRALTVSDKPQRELYVSLGCVIENIKISAAEIGYIAEIILNTNEESGVFVTIFIKKADVIHDSLFKQIKRRQINYNIFDKFILPNTLIKMVQSIKIEKGVNVRYYQNGSREFEELKNLILSGNRIQIKSLKFRNELIKWLRINQNEVDKFKCGLPYWLLGMPPMPKFWGVLLVRIIILFRIHLIKDLLRISSSSHLALFTVEEDTPLSWVSLGITLDRFLLKTTSYEIAHSYFSQPCSINSLSLIMKDKLALYNEYPIMLLRIGYADRVRNTLRRSLNQMLVN